MNASEGVRRLARVIRWIGDGIGGVIAVVGTYSILTSEAPKLGSVAGVLLVGAIFSGAGRAVSWILQGLAKSD